MYITEKYKYKKDNIIYIGSELPSDAEVLQTLYILNDEKGKDLIRLSDKENVGKNVWLKDNDTQENYIEVEKPEDERPERIRPNADR
jgi:hypothetical protein